MGGGIESRSGWVGGVGGSRMEARRPEEPPILRHGELVFFCVGR
jgi:hypothetical protein